MNMKILKKMAQAKGCKTNIINIRKGIILTGLTLQISKNGKTEIIDDLEGLNKFLKTI